MKKLNNKAFTLVELIVVITILAILWTIAFISIQWYSKTARDSLRISDIANITKTIELMLIKTGKVPIPDDKVDITASWTIISYQWYAGKTVLSNIWIFNGWKDPLDDTYYTYVTDKNITKYQVMWFLEEWEVISMNNYKVYAWLENRYPVTKWDDVWIILDLNTNEPIQVTWIWVDIINTNTEYSVYFDNSTIISWTWSDLKILKNGGSLAYNIAWYWPFDENSWTWTKDISTTWNNWTLLWNLSFTGWKVWNALSFSWYEIWFSNYLSVSNIIWTSWLTSIPWITINTWIKHDMDSTYFLNGTGYSLKKSIFKSHNTNTGSWWIIMYIEDWKLWFWWKSISSDEYEFYISNILLEQGDWINISVKMDYLNKTAYFYKNWKLLDQHKFNNFKSTVYIPDIISTADNFWYSTWIWRYKWLMDEMYLYNRVLSDSEIMRIYEASK